MIAHNSSKEEKQSSLFESTLFMLQNFSNWNKGLALHFCSPIIDRGTNALTSSDIQDIFIHMSDEKESFCSN